MQPWAKHIEWKKGDALDAAVVAPLVSNADGVIHSIGILLGTAFLFVSIGFTGCVLLALSLALYAESDLNKLFSGSGASGKGVHALLA